MIRFKLPEKLIFFPGIDIFRVKKQVVTLRTCKMGFLNGKKCIERVLRKLWLFLQKKRDHCMLNEVLDRSFSHLNFMLIDYERNMTQKTLISIFSQGTMNFDEIFVKKNHFSS